MCTFELFVSGASVFTCASEVVILAVQVNVCCCIASMVRSRCMFSSLDDIPFGWHAFASSAEAMTFATNVIALVNEVTIAATQVFTFTANPFALDTEMFVYYAIASRF